MRIPEPGRPPSRTDRTVVRGRRAVAALAAGLTLAAVAPATAGAALRTHVALDEVATGSAPFDAAAGPGADVGGTDDVVRSRDTVTYRWSVNANETTGAQGTFDRLRLVQTLPSGLSWRAADVPAYCKGAGWALEGRTLTCVYAPTGGGRTGSTLSFTLRAAADGVPDGTVASAATDAVVATAERGAERSPASTATPAPVTIRSAPFVDVAKGTPVAERVAATDARPAGYRLSYPVTLRVPPARTSTYGLRGTAVPDAPVTVVDDLSGVSPNARLDSCAGADLTCVVRPDGRVDLRFGALDAGAPAGDGTLARRTVRVFVPASDVAANPDGTIATVNRLTDLAAGARDARGTVVPSTGNDPANDVARYQLITVGGEGTLGFRKTLGAANGGLLAAQSTAGDGNGQVLPGQIVTSALSVTSSAPAATVDGVALCDVWDPRRLALSADGPGPAAHGGAVVWPEGALASWRAGTDYAVEYGTGPAATGDDAARWAAIRAGSACGDDAGPWTATRPADPATVTKVRIRLLRAFPATSATGRFRLNLRVSPDAPSDVLAANVLGTRVGTGPWRPSAYVPGTHAGYARGDRVLVNGVTVAVRKTALDPAAPAAGAPVSVTSGEGVRFAVTPLVTTRDEDLADPTATGVVVRDRLPAGMRFDAARSRAAGDPEPAVSTDAEGRQVLTWRLDRVVRGREPRLTYWATTASTRVGTLVNDAIVTSREDVRGLDAFPATTPPAGDQHLSRQTVQLQSPGGVQISKDTDQLFVEPQDDVRYAVTYANLTANRVDGVDVVDVLPFVGDGDAADEVPGRDPATNVAGRTRLAAVDVADGETVRYTDAPPATVVATQDPARRAARALPDGRRWCAASELGQDGCPVAVGDATAIRVTRTAPLESGADATVRVRLHADGDRSGDVLSNTASIRWTGGALGALSNVASVRVVASAIGDLVWLDEDADGRQDAGEPPVPGVRVRLTGTDKHGRDIAVATTTDADGRYRFTSAAQAGQDAGVRDLVSGRYVVTFGPEGLPAGARWTAVRAAGVDPAEDSDADPATGRSATIVLPDPAPTGRDGEDPTVDAGLLPADATGGGDGGAPIPGTPPGPPATPGAPGTPGAGGGPGAPTLPVPVPTDRDVPAAPGGDVPPARLTLQKRASVRTVRAGATVRYRLTVRNRGRRAVRDVRICDRLPAHTSVVRRGSGRLRDGQVCWTVRRLGAGASVTRTLTLRVDREARAGRLVNRAAATGAGVRRVRTRETVRVRPAPPRRTGGAYVTG